MRTLNEINAALEEYRAARDQAEKLLISTLRDQPEAAAEWSDRVKYYHGWVTVLEWVLQDSKG